LDKFVCSQCGRLSIVQNAGCRCGWFYYHNERDFERMQAVAEQRVCVWLNLRKGRDSSILGNLRKSAGIVEGGVL